VGKVKKETEIKNKERHRKERKEGKDIQKESERNSQG